MGEIACSPSHTRCPFLTCIYDMMASLCLVPSCYSGKISVVFSWSLGSQVQSRLLHEVNAFREAIKRPPGSVCCLLSLPLHLRLCVICCMLPVGVS